MAASSLSPVLMEHNRQLADIFQHMANCYRFLGADERFRANAYATAARTMQNLEEPVDIYADTIQHLDSLPGVGESIAAKIEEFLHTGNIKTFEELKKRVPYALLELMEVDGIGPATLRLLHDKIGIRNRVELVEALQAGRLKGLQGLGEKKISNLRRALKLPEAKQRLPWPEASKIGQAILEKVQAIQGVNQAALAGSLRRHKETVGDIDLVLSTRPLFRKRVLRRITSLPEVSNVIAAGSTKASVILKEKGIQLDVRVVNNEEFGAALFYFTGSKEHNIAMRLMAKQKGWKINEYGVFDRKGKRLAGESEEGIYQLFGMRFIPPEKRTGGKEIEEALR
ncbi:MAG: type-X family DNA polymerase [Chitinophagaceae bacterium]|nr:type-X family DNA polymerase [Chitinophagaceae bacterium]